MVMIFQSEKALRELLDSGIVYTFRLLHPTSRKLGKEWITYKRGGKSLADVLVSNATMEIAYPISSYLTPFVKYSGFNSVNEWIDEIKRLNAPHPDCEYAGEIFCVHLISKDDDLVSKYISGELK